MSTSIKQTWNAKDYATNGRFVANLASAVVDLLAPQPGERILDLGCGDGALTETIAVSGAAVTGVDSSVAMLESAHQRGLKVEQHDATELPFHAQFDAVFSNAALHWISSERQPAALVGIRRALDTSYSNARFVAEMGGHGNVAAIRTALQSVFAPYGIDAEASASSFFPSPLIYQRLLEEAGFRVESIQLIPRPTPLSNGMRSWLTTFRNALFNQLDAATREDALDQTVELLKHTLRDGDHNWIADYVRLRFVATPV